jgi:hypothetical protein
MYVPRGLGSHSIAMCIRLPPLVENTTKVLSLPHLELLLQPHEELRRLEERRGHLYD